MSNAARMPVRFSHLKHMAKSPAHFRHAVDSEGEETKALLLGRAVHTLLLGGPKVEVYEGRRAGKVWDAYQAAHPDSTILIPSEAESALGMRAALRANPLAMELLSQPHREEKLLWKFGDRDVQSTPDSFGPVHLVELKTTKCADPERFKRDATWRHYHAQMSFYRRALRFHGYDPKVFSIVAVESAAPYPVTILELTERAIEAGEKLWRVWFERMLTCEAANYWPSYSECVVEFDIEEEDEFSLSIGGEDVSFGVDA